MYKNGRQLVWSCHATLLLLYHHLHPATFQLYEEKEKYNIQLYNYNYKIINYNHNL